MTDPFRIGMDGWLRPAGKAGRNNDARCKASGFRRFVSHASYADIYQLYGKTEII